MIQVRTSSNPNWRELNGGKAEWITFYFINNPGTDSVVRSLAADGSWAEWRNTPAYKTVYEYKYYVDDNWTEYPFEELSNSIRLVFEDWEGDLINRVTLENSKGRVRTWRKVQKEIK